MLKPTELKDFILAKTQEEGFLEIGSEEILESIRAGIGCRSRLNIVIRKLEPEVSQEVKQKLISLLDLI